MKQDYQRIEKLIERFFEGQTFNEEEKELYAFFSSEKVPEHLLPYSPVFVYFETGIKEEPKQEIIITETKQPFRKKKIVIWASVAASILLLFSFGARHFMQMKEYALYEGSYIVRSSVKITDPKIVVPEIKKMLYLAQLQENEFDRQFQKLFEISQEDPFEQIMEEIKQQQLKSVEQIDDTIIRNELLEIFNNEL